MQFGRIPIPNEIGDILKIQLELETECKLSFAITSQSHHQFSSVLSFNFPQMSQICQLSVNFLTNRDERNASPAPPASV